MVHSEFMLFEIIKLYQNITGEDSIDYHKLEKAFYSLEEIASNFLGVSLSYAFDEELEKLEDKYSELFYVDHGQIGLADVDCELIRDEMILQLAGEDFTLDYCLEDVIQNICIYRDLEINVPIKEYEELFNMNATLMQNYLVLAFQEIQSGHVSKYSLALVKEFANTLYQAFIDLKHEDIPKIKVILAHYNDLYLLDEDSDVVNTNWYIALFSQNQNQIKTLTYNRISHWISEEDNEYATNSNEEDTEYDENTNEEEVDFSDFFEEEQIFVDECSLFLAYFTVLFNQYLLGLEKGKVKNRLIVKKYLLIGIQPDIENYYFMKGTIDTLFLPDIKKEWFNDFSFTGFYLTAVEKIQDLFVKDSECTSFKQSNMIICAIFIKTFLTLAVNLEAKQEIVDKLCYHDFYKNNDYLIATSLIDDVILAERGFGLHLDNH